MFYLYKNIIINYFEYTIHEYIINIFKVLYKITINKN